MFDHYSKKYYKDSYLTNGKIMTHFVSPCFTQAEEYKPKGGILCHGWELDRGKRPRGGGGFLTPSAVRWESAGGGGLERLIPGDSFIVYARRLRQRS